MATGTTNEALKDQVSCLENFVGVLDSDGVVALFVQTKQHTIKLVDLRKILDDFMIETSARITNIIEDVVSLTDVVKINLKCLEDDVALVKKFIPANPNEKATCFVLAIYSDQSKKEGKKKIGMLSAMQLKTRLQKGEETYLVALVEIKPDTIVDVPNEVADLRKEFADVMPPKLSKFLSPRRATDHKIELEPGVKPPAQAPYRMAPPQLVKLRKQLKELLDVGFIQPSKAPFGAPVLFQWKRGCALTIGP
ncbi:hypothetical protein F0562_032286 [Nyssa sinensis]|uniref:Uncharacterized protein n=1 Tax=Nyssa sinensis TaxID=561372 RepID=A0A5J5AMM9_9ASTE|nr:hypothetical protein F0562_032286 [Nyssa sinensis]